MSEMHDATLLLSHVGWIETLAGRLVDDPELAADAAQDTWVTALERRPDTRRPLRGWIATVLRNRIGKERARSAHRTARERSVSRAERTPSTYDVVAKASTQKDLVETVLALDEPYRETILLRYFEDLSYGEIARRTGVTVATVNSRLTRGLDRLRERLDGEYGDRRAWMLLFTPLSVPEGITAPSTGLLPMSTVVQASVLVAVSSAAVITAWNPFAGSAAAPLAPNVSLAGMPEEPEGIELVAPAARPEASRLPGAPDPLPVDPTLALDERDVWKTSLMHDLTLAPDISGLLVNTGAGDIEILRGGEGGMRIEANIRADVDRVDANRLTSIFEDHVLVEQTDSTVKIKDAHSERDEQGWSVSLVLHIPRNLDIGANSGAGNVTVRAGGGNMKLNSGAGDVLVALAEGSVETLGANSGAGNVKLELGEVSGRVSANSGAGDVEARITRLGASQAVSLNSGVGRVVLAVPSGVSGEFEVKTGQGALELPPGLGLTAEPVGGGMRARGRVGAGESKYSLNSGVGDVVIELSGYGGAR